MNPNQYVNRIRNAHKRSYAASYLTWLCCGQPHGQEPKRPAELSFMAAQAVRLNLAELCRPVD